MCHPNATFFHTHKIVYLHEITWFHDAKKTTNNITVMIDFTAIYKQKMMITTNDIRMFIHPTKKNYVFCLKIKWKKKIYKIFASKKLHQQIINGGRKKERERDIEKSKEENGDLLFI